MLESCCRHLDLHESKVVSHALACTTTKGDEAFVQARLPLLCQPPAPCILSSLLIVIIHSMNVFIPSFVCFFFFYFKSITGPKTLVPETDEQNKRFAVRHLNHGYNLRGCD